MRFSPSGRRAVVRASVTALGLAAVLTACSGGGRVAVTPDGVPLETARAEAAAIAARGHYAAFKTAAAAFSRLYSLKPTRAAIAEDYLRTLVLLRIRERQLAISVSPTVETALAVIRENPTLAVWTFYVRQADLVSSHSRGVQTDIDTRAFARWTQAEYEKAMKEAQESRQSLRLKAAQSDFHAYCYLAFYASMASQRTEKEDFTPLFGLFPSSRLMRYINAVRYMRENPATLAALAAEDPEFYEADFHLGEMALGERRLLSAEAAFLKAEPGLSDCAQVPIYLASIYTATEEFEKSLAYYDRTLALSPGYRDALLGKAISLSSLGRNREAIEVLDRMVALGNWLLGEAHYWLAWNRHAMGEDAAAQAEIEESKGRLPTNSEVFGLAGTLALALGQPDRAETEFKEALKYNAGNTEALFGLGAVNDGRSRWTEAAAFYGLAADVLGRSEEALDAKIAEIKAADLSEERRARMIEKKQGQLRVAKATRALAFYDEAADWFNARRTDKAREAALRAAAHPQFKEKAEALLARIKQAP